MRRKRLEVEADGLTSEISGGKLEEISKEYKPTVFTFQPTHYFKIPSDRLQEYEELLKERVGIPKGTKLSLPNNVQYIATCCPCCDDCGTDELLSF